MGSIVPLVVSPLSIFYLLWRLLTLLKKGQKPINEEKEKRVSVVILVYREQEEVLRKVIENCQSQKLDEIIVVNDGNYKFPSFRGSESLRS